MPVFLIIISVIVTINLFIKFVPIYSFLEYSGMIFGGVDSWVEEEIFIIFLFILSLLNSFHLGISKLIKEKNFHLNLILWADSIKITT